MSRVKIRAYSYTAKVSDPLGGHRFVNKVAKRNDELEWDSLSEYDQRRALTHNVFFEEGEYEAVQAGRTFTLEDEEAATSLMSVEELATWIKADNVVIDDLLELAEGDPEMAQRLLEADAIATGGEPRKGLQVGLKKIIDQSA